MLWQSDLILELIEAGLARRLTILDADDAVYGIDSLSELALHDVIAASLSRAGLGVQREVPYPDERKSRSRRSEMRRCDLVVTPSSEHRLVTTAAGERTGPEAGQFPLFSDDASDVKAFEIDASDALWMELKVVGQFCHTHGIPGPNSAYGTELVRALSIDLRKLQAREDMPHRGLLLIMFTEKPEIASHDVRIAMERALRQGVVVHTPWSRSLTIRDRIGNAACSLWWFPA